MDYLELVNKVDSLNEQYKDSETINMLRSIYATFPDLTLVSSFGADSAVLLHMISQINQNIPIVFIDTGKLFEETLSFQKQLENHFGLLNVQIFRPNRKIINHNDKNGVLYKDNADLCCFSRKVEPLARALRNTTIWISGRKKFQSIDRAQLPLFELSDMRIKVNPLINWGMEEIKNYISINKLPIHPLFKHGYYSIGCAPCTSPIKKGEDPRAGRWRGQNKTECGIHGQVIKPKQVSDNQGLT